MTKTQRSIMGYLLKGYSIAAYRTAKYRLRDENNCVVLTMNAATFRAIKPLLRKTPAGLFVADKNRVRQLHGNDLVKRRYKKMKAKQAITDMQNVPDSERLKKQLEIHR